MKSVTAGDFHAEFPWKTITSTSSPFIKAPVIMAEKIAKAVGAVYHEEEELFYIDCGEQPTISLRIGDREFFIDSSNLVLEIEESRCLLAIHGDQNYGYGPNWTLGSPFIRQYCNIHDLGKERIGFAEAIHK
ncbi:hypothetical protein ANCDUO_00645 [Ancylostoma duodenale]|uniref:Peptidase A1 domain-containing protein n=1 Tax=Ancylostoma duodenale TaxID=51022 RepID=A0A0C2HBI3_9BILA|nr:hypothetical protein ANCDUO_00645 [Ancylostoma duodenale]